jgi:hypothetical protein
VRKQENTKTLMGIQQGFNVEDLNLFEGKE